MGCIDALLRALRRRAGRCEEGRNCADYVDANRERMHNRDFRAAGLCVASCVVEAGCKLGVGTRC